MRLDYLTRAGGQSFCRRPLKNFLGSGAPHGQESGVISITTADHGSLKIVTIRGEFFLGHVRQVEDTWNGLVADKPEIIAIDCGEMTFIDSSAIGTFVKFLNNSLSLGIKLIFFDLSDSIERIFSKAKLNKIFSVLSREDFERLYMKS